MYISNSCIKLQSGFKSMFFVHDMGEIIQNEFLSFKEINILCYVYNFLNFVLLVVLAKFGMFDLVLRYEID